MTATRGDSQWSCNYANPQFTCQCQSTFTYYSGSGAGNVLAVQVTNADITSDQIAVTLTPSGVSGQLTIQLPGIDGGGHSFTYVDVNNQTVSGGSYTYSFNRNSLPSGSYNQVNAQWVAGGQTAAGSRGMNTNFYVLGLYRHSQYNTPNEASCSGGTATAQWDNPPTSCSYSPIQFISGFITQAWTNGSGISINQGPIQLPWGCPQPFPQNSFKPVSTITGSCNTTLGNSSLARDPNDLRLGCGDQILIVGLGTKTIADTCPACGGLNQMDNYTTQSGCSPHSIVDVPGSPFVTIRLH
jgi:hypothetical protein